MPLAEILQQDYALTQRALLPKNWLLKNTTADATSFWHEYMLRHRNLGKSLRMAKIVTKFLAWKFQAYARKSKTEKISRLWEKLSLAAADFEPLTAAIQHDQSVYLADLKDAVVHDTKFPQKYREMQFLTDEAGLLRVSSRLNHLHRKMESLANPILLAKDSPLARAVTYYVHAWELFHSGGKGSLVCTVRKKYWIIGILNTYLRF